VECEALSQKLILDLVRGRLDEMLEARGESLAEIETRE